ncbi:hypothetical protein [Streptomyces sp. AK02-01A]|uniref:hypothetical protein n=1 Tax=Streptomyces sp. AK02-01A TaxID=3028648 RepID=UPI0039F68464
MAQLVEPFGLVGAVPGVELTQASWRGELIGHDPDAVEWDLDEDDETDADADAEADGDTRGEVYHESVTLW